MEVGTGLWERHAVAAALALRVRVRGRQGGACSLTGLKHVATPPLTDLPWAPPVAAQGNVHAQLQQWRAIADEKEARLAQQVRGALRCCCCPGLPIPSSGCLNAKLCCFSATHATAQRGSGLSSPPYLAAAHLTTARLSLLFPRCQRCRSWSPTSGCSRQSTKRRWPRPSCGTMRCAVPHYAALGRVVFGLWRERICWGWPGGRNPGFVQIPAGQHVGKLNHIII